MQMECNAIPVCIFGRWSLTASTQRFRWVALQLKALQNCRNANEVVQMLKSLPMTLDETYDQIISKISKADRKFAVKVLQFLAFGAWPVTLEAVADLVAINVDSGLPDQGLDDPLDILDICSGLVTLSSKSEYEANKHMKSHD